MIVIFLVYCKIPGSASMLITSSWCLRKILLFKYPPHLGLDLLWVSEGETSLKGLVWKLSEVAPNKFQIPRIPSTLLQRACFKPTSSTQHLYLLRFIVTFYRGMCNPSRGRLESNSVVRTDSRNFSESASEAWQIELRKLLYITIKFDHLILG